MGLLVLFEHPPIERLAAFPGDREAAAGREPALGAEASPHLLLANLDDLSDEELDRLLSAPTTGGGSTHLY